VEPRRTDPVLKLSILESIVQFVRGREEIFEQSVKLPVSAERAFAWHEEPGALGRLTPPWENVRVSSVSNGIRDGSRVILRARVGTRAFHLWTTWEMEHHGYVAGREFNDRMLRGPFTQWEHRHAFEDVGNGTSVLTDTIRYRLPMGILGSLFGGAFTRRKLTKMFAYRHAVTREALAPQDVA
jgi:ligand-binding SRPBCC domain-containing protein